MAQTERFSNLPEYAFPRLRTLLSGIEPGGDPVVMTIGEPRHPLIGVHEPREYVRAAVGVPAAATFQHRRPVPRPAQAQGRDASVEPRTDDDRGARPAGPADSGRAAGAVRRIGGAGGWSGADGG